MSYACISIHMETEDRGFLTNIDNGDVFEINNSTKMIFELCNGELSLKNIFECLKEKSNNEDFEISEQDMLDIATFFVDNKICYVQPCSSNRS